MDFISKRPIKLYYIIVGLFLLTSCGLATKRDIANLKKDVQEVHEEVRSGARDQERQAQRQTELVVAVKNRVTEKKGLAGMIARGSPWSWFGLEFLLVGGFSFFASLRLNGIYIFRRAPITDDEYESLTVASWVLNKFLSRRRVDPDEPKPPDPPGPPNDHSSIRIVK